MVPRQDRTVSTLLGAALGLFGLEFVTGAIEAASYARTTARAYSSVVAMRATTLGRFLAAAHYWGSALALLVTFALVVWGAWCGAYRRPLGWFGAIGLAIAAFVFQLTGNLLPFDRHGVQTVTVEGGLAGVAPGVGPLLRRAMLGGPAFGDQTYRLWLLAHVAILVALSTACAWAAVRAWRPSAWGALGAAVLVAGVSLFVAAPLGGAAGAADYGAFGAQVSWYTWPIHGMLEAFNAMSPKLGWVGVLVVPTLVLLLLLALPALGPRAGERAVRLGVAIVGAGFLGCAFVFGGAPAALVGNRDPVAQAEPGGGAPPPGPSPEVLRLVPIGRAAFNSSAVGCSGCHGVDGVNGTGGPNLSRVYRSHDQAWIERYIRNPKSIRPAATMPAFSGLPDAQVQALAAYVSVDRTKVATASK